MIKKLLLLSVISISSAFADTVIYGNYIFNQDMNPSKMKNLLKTDTENLFDDSDTNATLYIKDNKLKFVQISKFNFELLDEIESFVKSGYSIEKLSYKNKFGSKQPKDVRELIAFVKDDLERSQFFNVAAHAEVLFSNILENRTVLLRYNGIIDRSESECTMCNELNDDNSREVSLLELFFTSFSKK